jgi:hypothetical protein
MFSCANSRVKIRQVAENDKRESEKMQMMPIPDLVSMVAVAAQQPRMRPRNDLREPDWMFWELRTLNMHRVVGLAREGRQFTDVHDLEDEIRGVLTRNFKRAWWRGIAYGVVVEVSAISLRTEDLKRLVDIRENEKGTLQWVILVGSNPGTAVGVHTWIEGYLSPVYRSILQALSAKGYRIASIEREKDGLMKFLTAVADVDAVIQSLGTRKTLFPEFREVATPTKLHDTQDGLSSTTSR